MLPAAIEDKYELGALLGSGAMSKVYEAVDRVIERRVAIKVVQRQPAGDPEAEESHARFRQEARAAGRLQHPGIVGVYDYGEDTTRAWIVMELVAGGSLKARLDRQERFNFSETVRLMDQMLAALSYSHARGVVHRDIKPANIMVTADENGALLVKLADFGIARLENSSMTQVGTLIGTPSYMAPEQLRGEAVDERADIWAAGVVLYQLLTGEKPFDGGFSTVMHKALHTEPPSPSQLSGGVPRGLDAVVARAMAKRPDDRFPTAAAFAQALRASAESNVPAKTVPDAPAEHFTIQATKPTFPAERAPRPAVVTTAAKAPRRGRLPLGLVAGGAAVTSAVLAAILFISPAANRADDGALRQEAIRQDAQRRADEAAEAIRRQTAPESSTEPQNLVVPPAPPSESRSEGSQAAAPPAAPSTASAPPRSVDDTPRQPFVPTPEQRQQQYRAAAAVAATVEPCSLLQWSANENGIEITGIIRTGGEEVVRDALQARGVPERVVSLRLQHFTGPYCEMLALLRPVATEIDAPRAVVLSTQPMAKDELLRLSVTMPAYSTQLQMSYLMTSGQVAHLVGPWPEPASAQVALGEPRGQFHGWTVDKPFGTDLILLLTSQQPLFPQRRPQLENSDEFRAALAERLNLLRAQGARVGVQVLVVETVLKR